MTEKLYTIEDAADFFQVSTKTIRNFMAEGILTGFKAGRDWRFTQEDLQAGVDRLRKKTDKNKAVKPEKKQTCELINA